jgi:hypothetical protein
MTNVAFMVSRLKSLKVIGRNKVEFHLDDLVVIQRMVNGNYLWFCRMSEVNPHEYGTGVTCGAYELGCGTQFDAEENALAHLVNMHRATGGSRRPKNRGKIRRQKMINEWNARRIRENTQ